MHQRTEENMVKLLKCKLYRIKRPVLLKLLAILEPLGTINSNVKISWKIKSLSQKKHYNT
jgi:hypothetical protein